jgi:hypothetical protein
MLAYLLLGRSKLMTEIRLMKVVAGPISISLFPPKRQCQITINAFYKLTRRRSAGFYLGERRDVERSNFDTGIPLSSREYLGRENKGYE